MSLRRRVRVRSSVTGRFVKAIVGERSPRETVTELVERPRVDDRHITVSLEVLGEVKPGDVVVAKMPADVGLGEVNQVRRELDGWVRRNELGAQVLVISDGLELGVDSRRAREFAIALLVDLEETIAEHNTRPILVSGALECARLHAYADVLEEGVSAARLILEDRRAAPDKAPAA